MTLKFLWVNFALTLRIVLFVLALGIGVATLIAGTQAALAANLKNISIVTGDELKLGDLFDGLEKNADYVLGPAPQPGKDMVLNARTLYRISTALNLSWRPASSSEQIIVRRAATVVPQNKIEEALKEALSGEGLEGRYNLLISGGDQQMILPHGLPDSFILKLPSGDDAVRDRVALGYRSECAFYQSVADRVSLRIINVDDDPELAARYGEEIPVVWIDGVKAFKYRCTAVEFADRFLRRRGER